MPWTAATSCSSPKHTRRLLLPYQHSDVPVMIRSIPRPILPLRQRCDPIWMDDVLCITSSTFKVSATVFLRAPRMINRYTITTVARIPFYRATVSVTDFCRGIDHHHYHSSWFDFSYRLLYLQRIPQSNPTIMAFILEPGTCRSRHRTSTSGLLIRTNGPSTGTERHTLNMVVRTMWEWKQWYIEYRYILYTMCIKVKIHMPTVLFLKMYHIYIFIIFYSFFSSHNK